MKKKKPLFNELLNNQIPLCCCYCDEWIL